MKIYFAGSIRGGRDDFKIYQSLIEILQNFGSVLTEHVGHSNVVVSEKKLSEKEIHDRDMAWLNQCDLLVAEVTMPSLGVGYEIGRAVENGKRILCLYRPQVGRSLSAMIVGCEDVVVKEYASVNDAKGIIEHFISR